MNILASWWLEDRGKVIVLLVIIWILAILQHPIIASVAHPFVSIILIVFFDGMFAWIRGRALFFSLSSIVTGLLIGLLFDPSGAFITLVTASLVASVTKQFLQKNNRHMFNPAALGIVVSSVMFHEPVAWWAVAWGLMPVVIIAVWMIPLLWKMRRLWMPLTFLVVYFLSNIYFQNIEAAVRLTFDGTVFLFAFVMLAEPMTSVNRGRWQYGWGLLVGILVVFVTIAGISIVDPLLLALLIANGIGFAITRFIPSIRTASH